MHYSMKTQRVMDEVFAVKLLRSALATWGRGIA